MKITLRAVMRSVGVGAVLVLLSGCGSVRELVGLPFDMAAHVAAETAKIPYEAAKMGAQGIVDVVAGAMR